MIQTIVPADGWSAVFVERGEDGEVELHATKLCCWGLVESESLGEEYRSIIGYGAADIVDPVHDCSNFLGYVHESDPDGVEKYREEAERHLRHQEERERKHQRLLAAGFQCITATNGTPRWWSAQAGEWLTQREALEQLEASA